MASDRASDKIGTRKYVDLGLGVHRGAGCKDRLVAHSMQNDSQSYGQRVQYRYSEAQARKSRLVGFNDAVCGVT